MSEQTAVQATSAEQQQQQEEQQEQQEQSSLTPPLHLLKDKWFVFYIVAVNDKTSGYSQKMHELDYVTSIEETFATLNTFPNPTLLRSEDNIVFARNKIEPVYESFPKGVRLCVYTKSKMQADEVVPRVVAAVLSESASREACQGESVIDVVRITHKPGQMYKDAVRVEVWAHACPYAKQLESYFNRVVSTVPGVQVSVRDL